MRRAHKASGTPGRDPASCISAFRSPWMNSYDLIVPWETGTLPHLGLDQPIILRSQLITGVGVPKDTYPPPGELNQNKRKPRRNATGLACSSGTKFYAASCSWKLTACMARLPATP